MTDHEKKELQELRKREEQRKNRVKRQNESAKERWETISCRLPKGTKARIDAAGETVNGLINRLIADYLDGDQLQRSEDQEEPAKAAGTEKTPEECAADLMEQARREQEETARREREELENAKPAEIRQSGELNKARQALKLEKIRKEEEENRAKMTEEQQRAQDFIDQARKKDREAAEKAEEAKHWEMWKPAINDEEK